jgi:LysM repeat protein
MKNLVVITMLLGVGYGAHVVLNRTDSGDSGPPQHQEPWDSPVVDMGQAQTLRPEVSLGSPTSAEPMNAQALDALDREQASGGTDNPLPPIDSLPSDRVTGGQAETASRQSPPVETAESAASPSAAPGYAGGMDELLPEADELAQETPERELGVAAAPPTAANEPNETDAADPAGNQDDEPSVDGSEQELAELARSVQQQLDQGKLAPALAALSQWYSSPSAREDRKAQLVPLLDQLAGTVIYSRRHLLEPAYSVQEHETLEQIAARYQVPIRLLAKVNGIEPPYQLMAGETLKVVRGPFRAETSISRRELVLFLNTYYAGRFTVRIGNDFSLEEGLLEVVEKLDQRPYTEPESGQQIPPASPDNPYGRHWIGLRQLGGLPPSESLGIHGTGENCGADEARGCIGLEPRDAEDLYSILSVGSTVRIVR